jgi:site-specific recombinase XerD
MIPRFHETVTIPVSGRLAGLRVIVTATGILWPLVIFMSSGAHKYKSPAWQYKCCHAIGILFDYMSSVPFPEHPFLRQQYLSGIVQKLISGTVPSEGDDATGLYWHPMSWKSLNEVLRYVNSFSDFCVRKFDMQSLNPTTEASFEQKLATFRYLDLKNENSLLKHLNNRKAFWREASVAREEVGPRIPKVAQRRPPFFPRDQVRPLLDRGFLRHSTGPMWRRYNIRDLMIAILQRFGGLRESEPFHLYVTDVCEDRKKLGHAEVRLYHPEIGRFTSLNPLTRRFEHQKRSEFLKQRYGRLPRNLIFGKERAGFKDLLLDFNEPQSYSLVRWFPECWGKTFWDLYRVYVDHILPSGLAHPYLFVNLSGGDDHGAPYHISAYNFNLRAALARIGLQSDKRQGTTSHGLRHGYSQDLTDAGCEDEIIQICLHHKSIFSQQHYKYPPSEKVSRELNRGFRILQVAQPIVGAYTDDPAHLWEG